MGDKSTLQKYLKHLENNGPELLLETAARDSLLTDAEYEKLYEKIRPKGRATKMADRDYAKEQS